jgi:FkbM family methyltransferase
MNRVSNVVANPVGIGSVDKRSVLSVNSVNLGNSSFDERFHEHLSREGLYSVDAEIRHGDSIVTELVEPGLPVGMIKIDVEGQEVEVLLGLRGTITRDKPVLMFETLFTPLCPPPTAVANLLREMGYNEFFEIKHPSLRAKNKTLKKVERILRGYELQLAEITRFEDRNYPIVVAIPG